MAPFRTPRLSHCRLSLRLPFRSGSCLLSRSVSALLLCALLFGMRPVGISQAQSAPNEASGVNAIGEMHANGWLFTHVVKVGELGFSAVNVGSVSEDGSVAIYGTRNAITGLYKISNNSVTTVAVPGTVFTTTNGTSGTITAVFPGRFGFDPEGRILVVALTEGGGLPAPGGSGADNWPLMRWDNGSVVHMLPSGGNISHNPTRMNNQGRWVAERFAGEDDDSKVDFLLTNGEVITPLLSYIEDDDCPYKNVEDFGEINNSGQLLYYTSEVQGSCEIPHTVNWQLRLTPPLTGAFTETISVDSGSQTTGEESTNGTSMPFYGYQLNDNGDVAYVVSTFVSEISEQVPTTQKLIVSDASGDVTLLDRAPFIQLHGFDNAKRVAFQILGDGPSPFYGGPNLTTDRIVGKGDSVLGETANAITLHDIYEPAAASFGDKRVFLFSYSYGEGGFGFFLASKGVTRWTNPAGGSWATASNWLPAEVPGATTETLFDIEGSYDVSVGTRSSGRSSVENGSVLFSDADLELQGPLTVGDRGSLSLSEGVIEAGELIIGHLPLVDPADPPLAKFNVMNAGTVFTTTGITKIGDAGRGELFISDAGMKGTSVEIGGAFPGAAIVGAPAASWTMDSIAIGAEVTGTLAIERGAAVRTLDTAVIGLGTSKQNYLATVTVDNGGTTHVGAFGHWAINNLLTIGDNLRGLLTILKGGQVFALTDLEMGEEGRADRQNFDGTVEIEGVGDDNSTPSRLGVLGEAYIGATEGARTSIHVHNGGRFEYFGLTLAEVEGSIAYLTVEGVHSTGIRSKAAGGSVVGNDSCDIGSGGRAQLTIRSGALFECYRVFVGVDEQSHGQVLVDGAAQGQAATLNAIQHLCVGGTEECSTSSGASGRLQLQNGGTVLTGNLVVGSGGVVVGTGQIAANFSTIEGQLSPGVELVPAIEELEEGLQAAHTHATQAARTGTLTFSGPITLSNSSVITIDISSKAAVDKLVIKGHAILNGKLVLNFSNGYAPRQGDTFAFLQSESSNGDFASVEIGGLAPGFSFEVTTNDGSAQLVANSNGVATTERDPFAESLRIPFVSK